MDSRLKKDGLSVKRFVEEILPIFKSWYLSGIKTNYVGEIYDFLILAEMNGIELNAKSYECLVDVAWRLKLENINGVTLDDINVKNEALAIIKRLKHFNELGLPFSKALAMQYNVLCSLEDKGENITFDTLAFLHTLGNVSDNDALAIYDNKKRFVEEFDYNTNNGAELIALNNWMCGYNYRYVSNLLNKEQKCNDTIYKAAEYDKMRAFLREQIGETLTVEYIVVGENGNLVRKKEVGVLRKLREGYSIRDFGTITLGSIVEGMDSVKDIQDDGEKGFIVKIIRGHKTIYECKTINSRIRALRLANRVQELKKDNLFRAYKEKFDTLEGLAYLQISTKRFIEIVDPDYLPVNNLFAYCFEIICSSFRNNERLLGNVLYAYNYCLSGKVESLKGANYGYPLYHFLSEEVLDIVKRVCFYVMSENLVEDVPEDPGIPAALMPPNYTHLTDEMRHKVLKEQILNGNFNLSGDITQEENDQSDMIRR